MNEFVSVILPVHNAQNTINATLNSIAIQLYKNFEIIIVNDGSFDKSEEKILEFKKLHPNLDINYFKQSNQGVSSARNFGLKRAKGDYIAFIDSDDVWKREKLLRQMEVMNKSTSIYMLACNRNNEKFNYFFKYKFERLNKISIKLFLLKNFMITPTVVFRKEIINKVGYFNENLKYSEDFEYFMRIIANYNAYLLNESLVITGGGKPTFGHSGLSSNLFKMEQGELKTIYFAYKKKFINEFEFVSIYFFSLLKFLRRCFLTYTNFQR